MQGGIREVSGLRGVREDLACVVLVFQTSNGGTLQLLGRLSLVMGVESIEADWQSFSKICHNSLTEKAQLVILSTRGLD